MLQSGCIVSRIAWGSMIYVELSNGIKYVKLHVDDARNMTVAIRNRELLDAAHIVAGRTCDGSTAIPLCPPLIVPSYCA